MKEIRADAALVARCGLYCGACRAYLKGRCPGCTENARAGWCKVRACGLENGYASCADCRDFADPRACHKFNNPISRLFGFIFRSDRASCIERIREIGVEAFAAEMAQKRAQSLPR